MKRVILAAAVMMLAATTQTTSQARAEDSKQVRAQGCVEPGVEAGCLIVNDIDSGKAYNVLIKGLKPTIGTGIEFTGVPHDGPTVCMQGTAIDVANWVRKESLKCSKRQAPKE